MVLPPGRLVFALLSFEGPDRYSLAGGLGVRVTHLAETLARRGHETHLFFVGDPSAPGRESTDGGPVLHRWSQWISAHHPTGVYAGEEAKLRDFRDSLPPFLLENVLRPAVERGDRPVVLAEEWHTAETVIRLHDLLCREGLRDGVAILWNANNTMSFHRIDWPRLAGAARITTVSRYMKHRMWSHDVDPLVIPNGIPAELLRPVPPERVVDLRRALDPAGDALVLFKIGRFDPAKRWIMAMEAAAILRRMGRRVVFPISGGAERHREEVLGRARELGLTVATTEAQPETWDELLAVIRSLPPCEIPDLRFFLPQKRLQPFYAAADAVLANSGHEPFGLVGLEAMAAGAIVFTGSTGEDYSAGGVGAVVLDTDRPDEIVGHVVALAENPERAAALRRAARLRAADFTWDRAADVLFEKVGLVARERSLFPEGPGLALAPRARTVVVYTVVHQPRRLRLPARDIASGAPANEIAHRLFDEAMNERYFRKVAESCYRPAIRCFRDLVKEGLELSIGFSLSFVEQARRWDPELLDDFRGLVENERVELVAVEPTHSFLLLWDIPRFVERMRYAADRLEETFGERPVVADTTEMMMSDTIYHALERAGFRAGFLDGRSWLLGGRPPTVLFGHGDGDLTLLARHHDLSDDVGYRFSNRGWECWPLTAGRYAEWLAGNPGDLVVLGWDFETFGEHHRAETGIFEFLSALPREVQRRGLSFATPSRAVLLYGRRRRDLPLPAFAGTWAGSGGLEFFLGNDAQRAVYMLMVQAYNKALLTGDPDLVELAMWLAQSDNLHLIQWFGRSGAEAEVSAYFTPKEWWSLGPDRIVWEMQQVYKNFIFALDGHLSGQAAEPGPGTADALRVAIREGTEVNHVDA